MRRLITILLAICTCAAVLHAEESADAGRYTVKQLQKRDSILIADQLLYSVEIEVAESSERIVLPDPEPFFNDTLVLVRSWQLDTVGYRKSGGVRHPRVRASLVVAPFEEGVWQMPELPVFRVRGEQMDTLFFSAPQIEVTTIQIDTSTFEMHDLKGQMRYPLTFKEVLPYLLAVWLTAVLAVLAWSLVKMHKRHVEATISRDPPYIVALRELDKYRGDKYWAPDKQKIMYSGITDTLRTYIESRFEINAEEMTTAEIFEALKISDELTPALYGRTKELFELSDFVKFAKHRASDEENARAVPVAAEFVTATYQSQMDSQAAEEGGVGQ